MNSHFFPTGMRLPVLWRQLCVKKKAYRWTNCLFARNLSGGNYTFQPNVNHDICLYRLQHNRHYWLRKSRDIDYYQKDGVSKDYKIVYQGPAKGYIEAARIAVLSCPVAMSLLGIAYLFDVPINISNMQPYIQTVNQVYVILGMYITFSLAVGLVVHRFVLRMYYNESSSDFVAILPGWGLGNIRQLRFKAGEASVVLDKDRFNIMPLKGQIRMKGQRVILLHENFQTPLYYNIMLGYEKKSDSDEPPTA